MRHLRARRLLASLGDGLLSAGLEAEVRDHAGSCRRCGRILEELRAAEALLAQLPASVIPMGAGVEARERLLTLARWAPRPPSAWMAFWRLPALGALAAAAILTLAMWMQPPRDPEVLHAAGGARAATASRMPASFLMPTALTSGVAYSWRL